MLPIIQNLAGKKKIIYLIFGLQRINKMLSPFLKCYQTLKFGVQSVIEKEEKKQEPIPKASVFAFPSFTTSFCKKCNAVIHHAEGKTVSLCLDCTYPNVEAKNNPQEIVIKPELIDASKLQDGMNNKALWRPSDFSQYVGQESLKNILNSYLRGCKELEKPFPHFLVDGKAGTGKTTIAYILASKLGLTFKEAVANTVKSPQQLIDLLVEVNGGVLLLDELQVINRQVATFLLPIMEDFKINGQNIKPFTLFGATTEKGILLKKWKPLVDRFKVQKTLDPYSLDELSTLLNQYKDKTFKNVNIEESVFILLAKNSRGTPRIGIRLLESFVYMQKPLADVFKAYNIVRDGITTEDIKVLKLLAENTNGIGLNSICAYLQTSVENFMYQQESYLIELGLMTIGNRRTITKRGKELLDELSKV
jgi:holliday junction DNA helicase RuvB